MEDPRIPRGPDPKVWPSNTYHEGLANVDFVVSKSRMMVYYCPMMFLINIVINKQQFRMETF